MHFDSSTRFSGDGASTSYHAADTDDGQAVTGALGTDVVVLDLHDTIQPASLRYVDRGLREAAEQHAELVIIEVDTPGGFLDSLRSMTTAILGSSVPVVVYVTPSGARAASAGFFLLLAADVAAMAPGTNTGVARPVMIGSQRKDDSDAADPSLDKAANDAAALSEWRQVRAA